MDGTRGVRDGWGWVGGWMAWEGGKKSIRSFESFICLFFVVVVVVAVSVVVVR